MARPHKNHDDSKDLLWGAEAIADAIGLPRSKVYHMLEHGQLPARKVGRRWVASRARLMAFLLQDEVA